MKPQTSSSTIAIPRGNLDAFREIWPRDLLAGLPVILLALPVCLRMASAWSYLPIAGDFTAVIAGAPTCIDCNSKLIIKGPATGLIIIGCVWRRAHGKS